MPKGMERSIFRVIALVRVKNGVDPQIVVDAVTRSISLDPDIRSSEVVLGLGLMNNYVVPLNAASYSMLLDFDDEDSWRRYLNGEAHAAADAEVLPYIEHVIATHYVRPA
jgi:hypothetical protein